MSAELLFEILEEEEEYINVWPALRILMRRDKRIEHAVKLLEHNNVKEAIKLLREAGLEHDQIIYIISTVNRLPLPEAENIYEKIEGQLKDTRKEEKPEQVRHSAEMLYGTIINPYEIYPYIEPADIKEYKKPPIYIDTGSSTYTFTYQSGDTAAS